MALGLVVVFLVVFVALFVLAHVILLPGALLIFVIVDAMIPRRYLVVTDKGLVDCRASFWTDRPKNVIAEGAHAALWTPVEPAARTSVKIAVGPERLKLRRRQYECMTESLRRPPADSTGSSTRVRSSTGLVPTSRERLIAAAVVGLVVVSGVVTTHLRASSSQNTSAATSPSEMAMNLWMTSYGQNYLAVSRDVGALGTEFNASTLHPETVRADCAKLQSDVQQASGYPAMPVGSLEAQWSSIVANLGRGAPVCISGIDQQNSTMLNQAQLYFIAASQDYVKLLKAVHRAGL